MEVKKSHLFCYVLPESLNSEIENICFNSSRSQASFVRECLRLATSNKRNYQRVRKAASHNGRKINDTQKKKLVYLTDVQYNKLQEIRNGTQISMASILRMGIEIHKDKVREKGMV
jgi:hypothetical protein